MRYRKLITIGAVVAACGALGGAPALASQPGAPHQAVAAAAHPGHAVAVPNNAGGCDVQNCFVQDGNADSVSADGVHATPFRTPVVGHVFQNGTCWPFTDCRFDEMNGYNGDEVLQFIDQDDTTQCLQTDSIHSTVEITSCGSHNAGTYWVAVGRGGTTGECNPRPTSWLVNVGITNHYDPFPYGEAMFETTFVTTKLFEVGTNRPIGNDDQFCFVPQS